MLELNITDFQNNILGSLNEILLLAYGTVAYQQILLAIKKAVQDIEQKHITKKYWQ